MEGTIMANKYYEYIAFDEKRYIEMPYMVYNQQESKWLCGLTVNMAEYTNNIDLAMRFASAVTADMVCVQLEDLTYESHIVYMEG